MRRINQSVRIKDDEGREWKKQHEIGHAFMAFYQKLFTAGECNGVDGCLADLVPQVTAEMNTNLLREFTVGEVETALHQIHPLKSPRPDGFLACFYQQSWHIIKAEVC